MFIVLIFHPNTVFYSSLLKIEKSFYRYKNINKNDILVNKTLSIIPYIRSKLFYCYPN